ncbi:MAG TPA: ferritin-like domain-containing protein [Kofleriaceae bacterium]|nr:ferritin-like domain-containing protein [Kofleriaceae bacterium]
MKEPFRADMELIRRRAREKMDQGAVTAAYRADREQVVAVLNEVLATEIVCTLRYKNHYFMARGVHGDTVADEFLEHAREEEAHADQVARRITQLGGMPNLDPEGLATRSHAEYKVSTDLEDMIREDLAAERVAIATYSEIIRWLGDDDPTTRRMMEEILAKEEEHADDLSNLLEPSPQRQAGAQVQALPVGQTRFPTR